MATPQRAAIASTMTTEDTVLTTVLTLLLTAVTLVFGVQMCLQTYHIADKAIRKEVHRLKQHERKQRLKDYAKNVFAKLKIGKRKYK